jgi:hypothetical protein
MILLAFAAAALAQWTGPHTEEYQGPGYFCGGGYRISLARGDRALILPQGAGAPAARVILAGRNVSIWSGVRPAAGHLVRRYGDSAVTEVADADGSAYLVSDNTDFALRLTSPAFHGYKRDAWFFTRANFATGSDEGVKCLAARSY